MNSAARIGMATSLLLLVPIACQEAGQPLGTINQRPTADAEGGGTYFDHDGRGLAQVALDGSRSSDPDGEIVSYVWTESETAIATEMVPRLDLPLGRHVIVLTVTDDEGATDSDVVIVHVKYLPDPETNTAPVAAILSPASGDIFTDKETITLVGRADDAEEGALPGERLAWSLRGMSDGPFGPITTSRLLGVGDTVRAGDLLSGEYVVILTATDLNGAIGVASVEVTVRFLPSFAEDVFPFLDSHCTECHGTDQAKGGIRLDGYQAILTGGNVNGPLIVPGDPLQGILIPQLLSDHYPVGWWSPNDGSVHFVSTVLIAWIEDGAPDN